MKLYVWTDFCPDWSGGLAVAIAKSEEDARRMIIKERGFEPSDWGKLHVYRTDRRIAVCVSGGS